MDWGAENSRRDASWVRSGFQEVSGEMRVGFSVGRKGGTAGGLGEIGGRILGCSRGVSGSGSLRKGERKVWCFWVDFRGRMGSLSLGIALECSPSLGMNSLWFFPLLFPPNSL